MEVKTVSQDKYAYNTLPDNTKLVYDEILYAIMHREEKVQIATTDVDEWNWHIWQCAVITVTCSG